MELLNIKAISDENANIIFDSHYLYIQGIHYDMRNWFLKKDNKHISIPVENILDISFMTIRSKKMLILFITISSLLFIFSKIFLTYCKLFFYLILLIDLTIFLYYFFKKYHLLRIVAKDYMIAFNTKYYNISDFEQLIKFLS